MAIDKRIGEALSVNPDTATVAELGAAYNLLGRIWDYRATASAILRALRKAGAAQNRYGDWVVD